MKAKAHRYRAAVLVAAVTLLCTSWSLGQASSASVARTMPVPLSHLYWHFLVLQNHLDRVAAAHEQQGQDGAGLRNYYQNRLGFSDAQFAPVRQVGQRLEPALKAIDERVKSVVDADHALHPRLLSSPNELPPVPAELMQLQKQHEAAIERAVANLKAALGAQETARLETFLRQEFVHNVTRQRVNVPHPHSDPSQHTVPPFPQEVRQ